MAQPADYSVFDRVPEPLTPPTLEQRLAEARRSERARCVRVILQHRTEIDVATSYFQVLAWLEEGTVEKAIDEAKAVADGAGLGEGADDADFGEVEDPELVAPIAIDQPELNAPPTADRAAAELLCSGLVERLVEFIANMRQLREENDRLRNERGHAELRVVRLSDYLRVALSIAETGEEQYRAPEASIAKSLGLVVEDPRGAGPTAPSIPDPAVVAGAASEGTRDGKTTEPL
jgi:hypothetical protein